MHRWRSYQRTIKEFYFGDGGSSDRVTKHTNELQKQLQERQKSGSVEKLPRIKRRKRQYMGVLKV